MTDAPKQAEKSQEEIIRELIAFVKSEGWRHFKNAYSMAIGKSILGLVPRMREIAGIKEETT